MTHAHSSFMPLMRQEVDVRAPWLAQALGRRLVTHELQHAGSIRYQRLIGADEEDVVARRVRLDHQRA